MPKKIRWLHLSDFHVGKELPGVNVQRDMFARVVRHVEEKKAAGWLPHFLFLTGDLANHGRTGEYERFCGELLLPLYEVLGYEMEARTFAVPGNHDVDRSHNQEFDRKALIASVNHHFEVSDGHNRPRAILLPRFAAYQFIDDWCASPKKWISSPEGAYHAVIEIDGIKVGIAGINTAWLCQGADDQGQLTPGKPLLEHALKFLADCELRLVLGHHSLDWFIQAEGRKIAALLGQNSAIYLYGDQHEIWAVPTMGAGKYFLPVQGGSVFQEKEGEIWRNSLLWAEADLETGWLRLQPRVWNANDQEFKLDTSAFPGDPLDHWWPFALPGTPQADNVRATRHLLNKPPAGWSVACGGGAVLGGALNPAPRTAQNFRRCLDYCVAARATVPSLEDARDGIRQGLERSAAIVQAHAADGPAGIFHLASSLTFEQFSHFVRELVPGAES